MGETRLEAPPKVRLEKQPFQVLLCFRYSRCCVSSKRGPTSIVPDSFYHFQGDHGPHQVLAVGADLPGPHHQLWRPLLNGVDVHLAAGRSGLTGGVGRTHTPSLPPSLHLGVLGFPVSPGWPSLSMKGCTPVSSSHISTPSCRPRPRPDPTPPGPALLLGGGLQRTCAIGTIIVL